MYLKDGRCHLDARIECYPLISRTTGIRPVRNIEQYGATGITNQNKKVYIGCYQCVHPRYVIIVRADSGSNEQLLPTTKTKDQIITTASVLGIQATHNLEQHSFHKIHFRYFGDNHVHQMLIPWKIIKCSGFTDCSL